MAHVREIPEMVGEFFDLAKNYLRQQTLNPLKRLARFAAFSVVASLLFILASLFLSVAVMRLIVRVMPDGAIWSGLGYIASAVFLFVVTGFVMWRAAK